MEGEIYKRTSLGNDHKLIEIAKTKMYKSACKFSTVRE